MKKNFLFINGHLNAGGCERSLVDILRQLDYSKYDVDLLLLEETGDYLNELPNDVHVHLYSLNNSYGSFGKTIIRAIKRRDWFSLQFRLTLQLAKIKKENLRFAKGLFRTLAQQYDSIIAYRPGICTDLAAYVFESNNKISWWHHGEMMFTGSAASSLNEVYQRMKHIVAVSKCSAELVKEAFPQIADRVMVIPNMICIEELRKKADEYRVELAPGTINIVSVGRMATEKNMILCPQIGEVLRRQGITFKWYLIGDGEEYIKIKKYIDERQLNDCFVLTGRLSNPYPYIKGATVMVHPSLVESQGITVLESMALKVPVIVVSSAGPREFIRNGVNGVLVENNNKEIADVICELVVDKDKMEMYKNFALETADHYNSKAIINKIESVIDVY